MKRWSGGKFTKATKAILNAKTAKARRDATAWLLRRGYAQTEALDDAGFAAWLRGIVESERAPFPNQGRARSYIRQVARLMRASGHADKPLSFFAEVARQDRAHGFRLANKQRKARTVRQKSDAARQAALAESADNYRERVESEWPIVAKGEGR